jgi:hypothetical protein
VVWLWSPPECWCQSKPVAGRNFFRCRWLENHLFASVSVCPEAKPQFVPVKLDHYCVEAIRRACLCVALRQGYVLLAPRLRFTFREVELKKETIASGLFRSEELAES